MQRSIEKFYRRVFAFTCVFVPTCPDPLEMLIGGPDPLGIRDYKTERFRTKWDGVQKLDA